MGQRRNWLERLRALAGRLDWSVLLAFILSLAFFLYVIVGYLRSGTLAIDQSVKWGAVSVLLFTVLFGIFRVLVGDIRREIAREHELMAEGCGTERSLLFFVLFKALIRCIVGVNLVLLWMAGLFAVLESFAGDRLLIGVAAALLLSSVIMFLAFGLVTVLDRVHYPCE